MNPEIIERDDFIVVGVRTVLDVDKDPAGNLWRDKFLPRRHEVQDTGDKWLYSVFNLPPSEQRTGKKFEYVAGVASSLDNIPIGMVGWLIPSGRYAQIVITGLDDIAHASRTLVTDWLPDSGYSLTSGVVFAFTDDEHPDSQTAKWRVNIPVETPEVLEELKKWLV